MIDSRFHDNIPDKFFIPTDYESIAVIGNIQIEYTGVRFRNTQQFSFISFIAHDEKNLMIQWY